MNQQHYVLETSQRVGSSTTLRKTTKTQLKIKSDLYRDIQNLKILINMIINKQTKLALIGMMLGDANIQKVSEHQVFILLNNIVMYCISMQCLKILLTHVFLRVKKFETQLFLFFIYYQLFKSQCDGIKLLFIHRYLKEPIVLAYWYMDDFAKN